MSVRRRLAVIAVIAVAVCACALSGCAPTGSTHPEALVSVPPRTGVHFATTLAGVPIALLRPSLLSSTPSDKTSNFVAFESTADSSDIVRFLVPSTVCVAGGSAPSAVPADYLAYLHSQALSGATIRNEDSISIDGVSGTELTLTGSKDIRGTVGQSVGAGCSDDRSFGIESNKSLRMAIFDVHGKTVLIWAQSDVSSPTPGFVSTFQKMLQTVTFG